MRMMGRPTIFKTRKTVNKTDQSFIIECTEQNAPGCLGRDKLSKWHNVEIRYAPNFLLKLLNRSHISRPHDLGDDDICKSRYVEIPSHQQLYFIVCLLSLTSWPVDHHPGF